MAKLEEISKKTLGSYIKKASKNAADWQGDADGSEAASWNRRYGKSTRDQFKDQSKYANKMGAKRLKGIGLATDKLTKEDMEQEEETNEALEALLEAYDDIIRGAVEDKPADVQTALKAALDAKIGERIDALRYDIPNNTFEDQPSNEGGEEEEWEDEGEWEVEDDDQGEIEVAEEEEESEEEAEQLDELKKSTLASYIRGAHRDRSHGWGSQATYEKRNIDSTEKSYDALGQAANIGSGLRGDDHNAVYNVRSNLHKQKMAQERHHNRKNDNRRRGVDLALNRLQGKFSGRQEIHQEPQKTPTGRDSKTKMITKRNTVYKDYKGE